MRSSFLRPVILSRAASLVALLLAIEFFDELVFGAREAAWPLMRADLSLSYVEVGLLLALPEVVSGFIEPAFGILGDTRHRRAIITWGGAAFAVALVVAAAAGSFWLLLVAFLLMYPASGAFVALTQATAIDASNGAHEEAMARWNFAGSIGVVLGPLALSAAAFGGVGWRWLFVLFAICGMALTLGFALDRPRSSAAGHTEPPAAREALRGTLAALRRRRTWRWLCLLESADLMGDVLLGFLALYMVDAIGVTPAQAGLAVGVWAGTGLAGDGLVIPLLRHVRGLTYLRASAVAMLGVYLAFLASPGFGPSLVALGLMGFLNSGWYAIPQAQLYASMPGRSGAVVAITSAFGLAAAVVPVALGLVAAQFGIETAMLLLAAGPVALIFGLPRRDAPAGPLRDVADERP